MPKTWFEQVTCRLRGGCTTSCAISALKRWRPQLQRAGVSGSAYNGEALSTRVRYCSTAACPGVGTESATLSSEYCSEMLQVNA